MKAHNNKMETRSVMDNPQGNTVSEVGASTVSKYPPQNHAAFVALGEEMERVKKMEGGLTFLCDLIEAIAEIEGLAIVDKAEYESLLDTAPCPYCGPGIRTGLPENACENCMNTGLKYPERDAIRKATATTDTHRDKVNEQRA